MNNREIEECFERLDSYVKDWVKIEKELILKNKLQISDVGLPSYRFFSVTEGYNRHKELSEEGRANDFLVNSFENKINLEKIVFSFFPNLKKLINLFLKYINENSKLFYKIKTSKQISSDFSTFIKWLYKDVKEELFVDGFINELKKISYHWMLIRYVRNNSCEKKEFEKDIFLKNNNLEIIVKLFLDIKLKEKIISYLPKEDEEKINFNEIKITADFLKEQIDMNRGFFNRCKVLEKASREFPLD